MTMFLLLLNRQRYFLELLELIFLKILRMLRKYKNRCLFITKSVKEMYKFHYYFKRTDKLSNTRVDPGMIRTYRDDRIHILVHAFKSGRSATVSLFHCPLTRKRDNDL